MAKPRVFVSSTYYDLRHIRNSLETFIQDLGYEPVLFESGDIAFRHDAPIDESCYHEIPNCHMLVLIIGGRYGSPSSDSGLKTQDEIDAALQQYNSITKKEYQTAIERDIPVFIFVEKSVLAEYQTFKGNRDNDTIKYAHVDSINIFRLLDTIIAQRRNNFVQPFYSFSDIANWLRDQWGGLFADFLSQRKSETSLSDLASQLNGLRQVVSVLKEYSESIMRKVQPEEFQEVIKLQEQRLREETIHRFAHEEMIEAIRSTKSEHFPSDELLYSAFEKASDLDEFMKLIKFTDNAATEWINNYRELAERHFAEYKRRYLHDHSVEILGKSLRRGKAIQHDKVA